MPTCWIFLFIQNCWHLHFSTLLGHWITAPAWATALQYMWNATSSGRQHLYPLFTFKALFPGVSLHIKITFSSPNWAPSHSLTKSPQSQLEGINPNRIRFEKSKRPMIFYVKQNYFRKNIWCFCKVDSKCQSKATLLYAELTDGIFICQCSLTMQHMD